VFKTRGRSFCLAVLSNITQREELITPRAVVMSFGGGTGDGFHVQRGKKGNNNLSSAYMLNEKTVFT